MEVAMAVEAVAEPESRNVAVSVEFVLGTLLATISGLVSWAFHSQSKRITEEFASVRKEMSQQKADTASDLKKIGSEFDREIGQVIAMHERDHEGAKEGLRIMMEQHGKLMSELWEEIKQGRKERVESESKLWESIDRVTDKVNTLHLELAKSYPTKEELSKLLDEKLRALKDGLNRRRADGSPAET